MTSPTIGNSSNKVMRTIDIDGEEVPGKFFTDCRDLENVNIREGIQSIGYRSFQGCENIQSVQLPLTTKEVDGYAFCDCKSAKSITLNHGLERICHRAFMGCASVVQVEIPSTLNFLGKDSFRGCTSLKEVRLLGCPDDIKKNAFSQCPNLERIVSMSNDASQIQKVIPKSIPMERVEAKDGWAVVYERVQKPATTAAKPGNEAPVVVTYKLDPLKLEQAIAEASLAMSHNSTVSMNNRVTRIENECKWLFDTIQNQRDDPTKYTEAEMAEYQRAFKRKVAKLHRVSKARDEFQQKLGIISQQ